MGNLEEVSRKRLKRMQVTRIILGSIAAVGVLGVSMAIPNSMVAMKLLDFGRKRKMKAEYGVRRALNRLVDDGSIKKIVMNGKPSFELTDKGRRKLGELYKYHALLKKPKRWDGRWRIVSFDVFEKRRGIRDKLRSILKSVGFIQLHQSMWVYPYDCEDLITLLKSELGVGRNVLYIIADTIESDKKLKDHFKLS